MKEEDKLPALRIMRQQEFEAELARQPVRDMVDRFFLAAKYPHPPHTKTSYSMEDNAMVMAIIDHRCEAPFAEAPAYLRKLKEGRA